jgi:hypothetical protein
MIHQVRRVTQELFSYCPLGVRLHFAGEVLPGERETSAFNVCCAQGKGVVRGRTTYQERGRPSAWGERPRSPCEAIQTHEDWSHTPLGACVSWLGRFPACLPGQAVSRAKRSKPAPWSDRDSAGWAVPAVRLLPGPALFLWRQDLDGVRLQLRPSYSPLCGPGDFLPQN